MSKPNPCDEGKSTAATEEPRGFVILIVLAVLATMGVLLSTQLQAVEGQEAMQIRMSEEAKARAIAEHCVQVADSYAVNYGNNGSNIDFDLILSPSTDATQDYLPPSNILSSGLRGDVYLPPEAPSTAMYRYRAFDVAEPPGTCFIRYDDNFDDVNPNFEDDVTGNTRGLAEGTGTNVPNRDRDRTLIITVIAVAPPRADLEDSFKRAHARVTLRRVRAMPKIDDGAIQAGGNVTFGSGSICGSAAGVVAQQVSGACVCGQVDAQLAATATLSTGSCAGCTTCASTAASNTAAGTRPTPTVTVPPTVTTLLANEALGGEGTSGNHIANLGHAAVYARSNGTGITDVFAWDPYDTNTNTTLSNRVFQSDGTTAFTAHNCTTASTLGSSDPIPDPCTWNLGVTVTAGQVLCTASQTPCWKLVARMGG